MDEQVKKTALEIFIQLMKNGFGHVDPGLLFMVFTSATVTMMFTPLRKKSIDVQQVYTIYISLFYGVCFLVYHGFYYGLKKAALFSVDVVVSIGFGIILFYVVRYFVNKYKGR